MGGGLAHGGIAGGGESMLGIHPNLQGDPKPEQCPGDLDDTGSVGVPDLLALLS